MYICIHNETQKLRIMENLQVISNGQGEAKLTYTLQGYELIGKTNDMTLVDAFNSDNEEAKQEAMISLQDICLKGKYSIQDKEAGNISEIFNDIDEAFEVFEEEEFEEDFFEVYDLYNQEAV